MGPKHSLRTYVGIAARATGRRDHRHAAALRRGRSDVRIDARRRANDAVGTRQLLAQRLAGGVGALRLVVLSHGEALLRAGFRIARFLGHYFGRRIGQWRSLNGLRKRKRRHQRGPKQQRDPQFRQMI